jgi:hypothetical protein
VKSYVETDPKTGQKTLFCFYQIANYSEVIETALREHNLTAGKVNVLCKPVESRCVHGMIKGTCYYCLGNKPTKTAASGPKLKGI